jgi:copper homeostasis protein
MGGSVRSSTGVRAAKLIRVHNSYILEISVETLDAALAAQRGDADRIELCSDLAQEGLTPGTELMRVVRDQVDLPIFTMIRPRGGDFVYSDAEFAAMKSGIASAGKLGMDGVVLGILKEDRHVDIERTRQLVELARPLPVTFHRAFDVSADVRTSLEDVIATGATRILTSGGAPTAPEGLASLAELVAAAGDRIIIVPGSGINASNALGVAQESRACEFHSGLSSVMPSADRHGDRFAAAVRELAGVLAPCVQPSH